MAYIVVALVLVMIGFVIWLWTTARKAGATSERAAVATRTAETLDEMDEAAAQAPRTPEQVVDSLRKGGF